MKRVLVVFGTRPQYIKVAALWHAAEGCRELEFFFVDSGQHYDATMSEVFVRELAFPPLHGSLGVSGLSPVATVAETMLRLEKVFAELRPDAVLVLGDTNTTLAGALAARKAGIYSVHVESGLRSFVNTMPEEVNRLVADRVCDLLLAPVPAAIGQLRREGFPESALRLTGDLTLDIFRLCRAGLAPSAVAACRTTRPLLLVTLHRDFNVDHEARLAPALRALDELADDFAVRFFMHPRTLANIARLGLESSLARIEVQAPIGYMQMLAQLEACALVLTDSGGLQKDAAFAGKPCLVYRDRTEWIDLVDRAVWLVGDAAQLPAAARRRAGQAVTFDAAAFGDGAAGANIVQAIREGLGA
ncbi:MAG: non-hydrolyzing UDP-N-acetylglucosamine 2-epimerase [Gammaproteobacteria bacterium]